MCVGKCRPTLLVWPIPVGIILGILLIGLITIIVWRCLTYAGVSPRTHTHTHNFARIFLKIGVFGVQGVAEELKGRDEHGKYLPNISSISCQIELISAIE